MNSKINMRDSKTIQKTTSYNCKRTFFMNHRTFFNFHIFLYTSNPREINSIIILKYFKIKNK